MSTPLESAILAARQAGAMLRAAWGQRQEIKEETRHDIKLMMDVQCETLIRQILGDAFPDYAFLGEEKGGSLPDDRPAWIIDPLDGTVNYAHGIPHFCTSIALHEDGEYVLGVVYSPITDEMYTAVKGQGAFRNGDPIHVSDTAGLAAANISMGFSKSLANVAHLMTEMNGLAHTVRKIRIMGAAALDMSYVAAGRFDGFLEYGLRTWDIAAGTVLIREAGGRVFLTPRGEHIWDVRADNGRLW